MMSPETIASESRAYAKRAAKAHRLPYMVAAEDVAHWRAELDAGRLPSMPFPRLGDYVPDGWERVEELFVDSSGLGGSNEPAMSTRAFIRGLEAGYGYAITDVGQFQLYVGKYRRLDKDAATA